MKQTPLKSSLCHCLPSIKNNHKLIACKDALVSLLCLVKVFEYLCLLVEFQKSWHHRHILVSPFPIKTVLLYINFPPQAL